MSTQTPQTLPTGPVEHPAMDHAGLRAAGIRLLGQLAADQWTDFNTSDPGVVILEQLCYAITDLAYRIDHPVPDLLAGTAAMPGPAEILTGDPVTLADLRRLVLDEDGVANARIAAQDSQQGLAFYHHRGSQELRLEVDPADVDAPAVKLSGLHRVWLQPAENVAQGPAVAAVAARLHAHRGLASDFVPELLGTHEIRVTARLEVGPIEDPTALLTDLFERLGDHLAPRPRHTSLADALADGRRIDELFEGPALDHGFVNDDGAAASRTVRTSDLIHVLMDVPAVRAVRSLILGNGEGALLEVPPGKIPVLAAGSTITLLRAGLQVRADAEAARTRLVERRLAARARIPTRDDRDLAPAPGRDRNLARYTSIRRQLPAVFGVGPLGLASTATPERRAQAHQLAAYLHLFDQLLANQFAQLAHAGALLTPDPLPTHTYFAQPVDDPDLAPDALLLQDPQTHREWLATTVERTGGDPRLRRLRFLSHLLARHAEQLGDYAQIDHTIDLAALIADREAFLRQYPRLSGARGSGHDILALADEPSGLELRLSLKLGLRDQPGFHIVEHILLRPVPEDARQRGDDTVPQVPLLAGVSEQDPYSSQVTYVFAERPGPASSSFEQLVAETILAETPAHIRPRLLWFADGEWTAFTAAWTAFRNAHRIYRITRLYADQVSDEIHLRLRDARDRVIDLLEIARTYPLRDLPLPSILVVSPGDTATISIAFSQPGVVYALRDRRTGAAIQAGNRPITADGTGGTITLETPPITVDSDFRILATKVGSDREAWLHGVVRVIEGVDTAVVARIRTSDRVTILDPRIEDPRPGDARIADHNTIVEVEVLASQEGVRYELVDHADPTRIVSDPGVIIKGNSQTIVLRTRAVLEDFDIRVRGHKTVGDPQNPEQRSALLAGILPLRVRANTTQPFALVPPVPQPHGSAGAVRLGEPENFMFRTQKSATYQLWRRRLRDDEFLYSEPPPLPAIGVLDGERRIFIAAPTPPLPLVGFEAVGAPRPGTGGALELPGPACSEDTMLVVTCRKRHRLDAVSDELIDTEVVHNTRLAALVRPDPARVLRLQITIDGATTTGPAQLLGGQPGVFYQLVRSKSPLGRPAYFHQLSDAEPERDKGIGSLRVEGDLTILDARTGPPGAPAQPPTIDLPAQPVGVELAVTARRATTDLTAPLQRLARIDAVPPVVAQPALVDRGAAAKITIATSDPADTIKVFNNNEVLLGSAPGGPPIAIDTGPLNAQTQFTVTFERTTPDTHAVTRRVLVVVDVKP